VPSAVARSAVTSLRPALPSKPFMMLVRLSTDALSAALPEKMY